jgi:hypothetical protein
VDSLRIALVVAGAAAALPLAGSLAFLALFLPLTLRSSRLLGPFESTRVDGLATLEETISFARASGGTELERAELALSLAARKFRYSRRNPWDGPARCYERGYGYCVQQARALKALYEGLGIECRLVQAFRVRFDPMEVHGKSQPGGVSGHMWLRARIDGKEYDACPGDPSNRLGRLAFAPLSKVRDVPAALVPVLHVFSAAENVRRDLPNLLRRARHG